MPVATVNIYNGKMKSVGLFIASIIMTLLSLFMGVGAIGGSGAFVYLLYAVSIVGVLFFGYAGIKIFKQIFRKEPVLILSEEGFINKHQSYSKNKPLVYWREVVSISVRSLLSETFVCIELEDQEAYVESMSKVMRMGTRTNMAMGYPVITLSANGLKKYDTETLYALFNTYWTRYGNKPKFATESDFNGDRY